MSPSVNHPLSSRAALVPAMLVGAAVALALLAIPSAAASDGPGEWLLTGLENRWKWGADWTPEFGPWAWLVFAPATAETWLWQLGFALAGGAAAALGFDAVAAAPGGARGVPRPSVAVYVAMEEVHRRGDRRRRVFVLPSLSELFHPHYPRITESSTLLALSDPRLGSGGGIRRARRRS